MNLIIVQYFIKPQKTSTNQNLRNRRLLFKICFLKLNKVDALSLNKGGSEKDNSSETEDDNLFGTGSTCIFDKENKTEFNALFLKLKDNQEVEPPTINSTFEISQTTPKVNFISNLAIHKGKYPHISKHLPSGGGSSKEKGSKKSVKSSPSKNLVSRDDFSSFFQSSDEKPQFQSTMRIIDEEKNNEF